MPQIAALLMFALWSSAQSAEPPVVSYPVTYPLDYRGRYLTQREADQIVSFIKTVRSVDHRVVMIDVTSSEEVEVHTGPGLRISAGDTLHLRGHHGAWRVVSRSKGSGF